MGVAEEFTQLYNHIRHQTDSQFMVMAEVSDLQTGCHDIQSWPAHMLALLHRRICIPSTLSEYTLHVPYSFLQKHTMY